MKKTASLLLVIALIISCFSVCAFAEGHKTDALLAQVANAKEMKVTLRAGNTMLGSSTETYYIKGNNAALDWTNGFIKIRVVLTDGKAYAYLPSVPFLFVKLDTGLLKIDISQLMKTAMGATSAITVFESEGDEVIDGVNYHVETYNDRAQAKLKYCYVGDELKLLKVTNRTGTALESVNYTYFDDYGFSVDDSIMKVPTGFDLTPILSSLLTSILASVITL